MKNLIFVCLGILCCASITVAGEYNTIGATLISPATNVSFGAETGADILVTEVRGRFSSAVTTATDVLSVDVNSADGATYDFRLCAPDHNSDGTPSIGNPQTFRCSFDPPFLVNKGESVDLNFTNTDSLNIEAEMVFRLNR